MKKLIGLLADLLRNKSGLNAARSANVAGSRGNLYVYVEDDGTARALEADELDYLNTDFLGGDGGRPYIKSSYGQLTPDKRIGGYLLRRKLPTGARIKSTTEATPVETPEEAIKIATLKLPISFCIKSGTRLERVIDPRSGRTDFGVPGIDVASGTFSATIEAGVWRVARHPNNSALDTEQACFADISAASGRIIQYGWL